MSTIYLLEANFWEMFSGVSQRSPWQDPIHPAGSIQPRTRKRLAYLPGGGGAPESVRIWDFGVAHPAAGGARDSRRGLGNAASAPRIDGDEPRQLHDPEPGDGKRVRRLLSADLQDDRRLLVPHGHLAGVGAKPGS